MKVVVESLLCGAGRAAGRVAIIDVFRAFTTAAVALANGASRIVMVGTVDEALDLRARGVAQVCIGEVRGRTPPGFDFGNSPFEVSAVKFGGRTLVQRTSAGTQGIVSAKSTERLYASSLVTASATAWALVSGEPDVITLVAMGRDGAVRTDEDELCALHLRNLLEGRAGNADAIRKVILAGSEAERFGDPGRPHLHPGDLDIALDVDRYDFAVRVDCKDVGPTARMERSTRSQLRGEGDGA